MWSREKISTWTKIHQLLAMESPLTRELSQLLFRVIKPPCVRLSELTESFEASPELHQALSEISHTLYQHQNDHKTKSPEDSYVLSPKLGDYVFFPITNILKQPSLDSQITAEVLKIMTFLIANSWSFNASDTFLDQISPVIILLCVSHVDSITPDCILAALDTLVRAFPRDFLKSDPKRLSYLGDVTNSLLGLLSQLGTPLTLELNTTAESVFRTLEWLYSTRVSAEQTSLVFPGLVSKTVNFQLTTRNVKVPTVVAELECMSMFILKVFGDHTLDIQLKEAKVSSALLLKYLLNSSRKALVEPVVASDNKHRTSAWLTATSKQLKLSLLAYFKHLLLSPSSRSRSTHNLSMREAIIDFCSKVTLTCFLGLYTEVVPALLDILATLICISSREDAIAITREARQIYLTLPIRFAKLSLSMVIRKLEEMVADQVGPVIQSGNSEKASLVLSALEFQLDLASHLSELFPIEGSSLGRLKGLIASVISQELFKSTLEGEKDTEGQDLADLLTRKDRDNTLDNIQLPTTIDAKKLTKFKTTEKEKGFIMATLDLRNLSVETIVTGEEKLPIVFGRFLSKEIELRIGDIFRALGLESNVESLVAIIVGESSSEILESAVRLWTANQIYAGSNGGTDVVDEFLSFDEESSPDDETKYLLLERAQDLVEGARLIISENVLPTKVEGGQISYGIAIESFGILSSKMSKEDFEADVLMDYLYPILEALTFPVGSHPRAAARYSLQVIVNNHYDGSLQRLIMENSEHLLDSVSMNMCVASNLTPTLSGILLVLMKIAGRNLLEANQIQDVLSEMFIVIDTYHGYSTLVESFFLVFEEVVSIATVSNKELLKNAIQPTDYLNSTYKPWGVTSITDMLELIDEAHKQVDPYENYDPDKEVFKRKADVPFSEMPDSDDEDEEEPVPTRDEEDVWESKIPKTVYHSIMQIFIYGFQLLSHPSMRLQRQILLTMQKAYAIIAASPKSLLPILAQYWPKLLVLMAGSTTTSDHFKRADMTTATLPALELCTEIIERDEYHGRFMSQRFIDAWAFLKSRVMVFRTAETLKSTAITSERITPQVLAAYSRYLITGLVVYGKLVPDLMAYEIVKGAELIGIAPQQRLSREVENLLWVIRLENK